MANKLVSALSSFTFQGDSPSFQRQVSIEQRAAQRFVTPSFHEITRCDPLDPTVKTRIWTGCSGVLYPEMSVTLSGGGNYRIRRIGYSRYYSSHDSQWKFRRVPLRTILATSVKGLSRVKFLTSQTPGPVYGYTGIEYISFTALSVSFLESIKSNAAHPCGGYLQSIEMTFPTIARPRPGSESSNTLNYN